MIIDRQDIVNACAVGLLATARRAPPPGVILRELVTRLQSGNPDWDIQTDELENILRRLAASNGVPLTG